MRAPFVRILSAFAVLAALSGAGAPVLAAEPPADALVRAIDGRIPAVEEFRFIREQARRLGVRAWLFGGTAAGFGHYVKWDLEREQGDQRFQKDRFDYDYTNIYRSTQDLDLVIDGTPEQAGELQRLLEREYPHFQGSKTAWEVRLLRDGYGDKIALLDNPEFLDQHTDSNSTGMIELTDPARGEPRIRDLRNWRSADSHFLRDLREGELHYYFSPVHDATARAAQGLNPPILSVIRYFTKLFQYELRPDPRDLEALRGIIARFDPRSVDNPYVASWIERNGKKLIQHAVNIEYASRLLDDFGLRDKLIGVRRDPQSTDSLAWWLSRKPLVTRELGSQGRTARQLGLEVVAHETGDFLAYESITRAHTGVPNVLVSRAGVVGESASYGEGFYTRVGREGARNTGFTIRFQLRHEAREGEDFDFIPGEGFVVVKNKAALRVIPESLRIDLPGLFEVLARDGHQFSSEKGVMEKFRRKMPQLVKALTPADFDRIRGLVEGAALEVRAEPQGPVLNTALLAEWFKLPGSEKHPEVWNGLVALYEAEPALARSIRQLVVGLAPSAGESDRFDALVRVPVERMLSGVPQSDPELELVVDLLAKARRVDSRLLRHLLTHDKSGAPPSPEQRALAAWLANPASRKDPAIFWELVDHALEIGERDSHLSQKSARLLEGAMAIPAWSRDRELTARLWAKVQASLERQPANNYTAGLVAEALVRAGSFPEDKIIRSWLDPLQPRPLRAWLARPESRERVPGIFEELLKQVAQPDLPSDADYHAAVILEQTLREVPHWRDDPRFRARVVDWAARSAGRSRTGFPLWALFHLDRLGAPEAWPRIEAYALQRDPHAERLPELLFKLYRFRQNEPPPRKYFQLLSDLLSRNEKTWSRAGRLRAAQAFAYMLGLTGEPAEYFAATRGAGPSMIDPAVELPRLALGVPLPPAVARERMETIRSKFPESKAQATIDEGDRFVAQAFAELDLPQGVRLSRDVSYLRGSEESAQDVFERWFAARAARASLGERERMAREIRASVIQNEYPKRMQLPWLYFALEDVVDHPDLVLQTRIYLGNGSPADKLFAQLPDERHHKLIQSLNRYVLDQLERGPRGAPLIASYLAIPGISTQADVLAAIEARGWPMLKVPLENARKENLRFQPCAARFGALR